MNHITASLKIPLSTGPSDVVEGNALLVATINGRNAEAVLNAVDKVFKPVGYMAVGIEQLLEAANDINQGAGVGTTLTGAAVNTALVVGTSVTLTSVAESAAIGFAGGSEAPVVGNLAGMAGGIVVGLTLGSPAQTGQTLSQSFSNSIAIEETNAEYGTGFYYPGG